MEHANGDGMRAVAAALRRLRSISPAFRGDLDAWNGEARAFVQWLHACHPDVALPARVMFFLHDADLRIEDEELRRIQEAQIDEIICGLENGELPAQTGVSVSVHPIWIVMALAMAVGVVLLFVRLLR